MNNSRTLFEQIITRPPFEYDITRKGEESAWPGSYKDPAVELAWGVFEAAGLAGKEPVATTSQAHPAAVAHTDAFHVFDDMLYSLMPDGFHRGREVFKNRIWAQFYADRSVSEEELQRVIATAQAALSASPSTAALVEALEGLVKHFPLDSTLVEAGWSYSDMDSARDALARARSVLAAHRESRHE